MVLDWYNFFVIYFLCGFVRCMVKGFKDIIKQLPPLEILKFFIFEF